MIKLNNLQRQLKFIAYIGIVYLISYIPQYIYYFIRKNQLANENITIILFVTYIISLFSTTIFFYGFIILGEKFKNNYLTIGALIVIFTSIFYYLFGMFLVYSPEIKLKIIDILFLLIFGISGFVFGIGLLKIRHIFGYLAVTAGIMELAIGFFFISIKFYIPGYILLIPAGIIEILLLFKASKLKQLTSEPIT